MKKIGIITLIGDENFGNRLQNYALQKKISEYDCDVENLNTNTYFDRNKYLNKKFVFLRKIKRLIIKLFNCFNIIEFRRRRKFVKFRLKYLNQRDKKISYKNIKKESSRYDILIYGSDQIWSPTTSLAFNVILPIDNLSPKTISYSASFGHSQIPKCFVDIYKDGLSKLNMISVRENTGKKISVELTKRNDVEVLVDPTMLLTTKEWNTIIEKPLNFEENKKYILCYFLGGMSLKVQNEIQRVANEFHCNIIDILNKKSSFYILGPSEFLYLEKNAFLICTDSFHSSVFAILYNVPFIIFNRENSKNLMNSRIETLLDNFKIKNRIFDGDRITQDNLKHDYTEAYKILEKERKKSKDFLDKAISMK